MPLKVLIVDDSAFFRRRIKEILEKDPQLQIVAGADNGRTAVEKTLELQPDVITMDYEMPVMDGITAVREIMAKRPTPILMFSSLTYEGARVTLDALDAGAVDYLPKSFESMSANAQESAKLLQEKVLAIAKSKFSGYRASSVASTPVQSNTVAKKATQIKEKEEALSHRAAVPPVAPVRPVPSSPKIDAELDVVKRLRPRLLIIGSSTGGPIALQKILTELPANFPIPILLVQHMPGTFTQAFAQRLDRVCQIRVKEAQDNDPLRPGVALLAPGGMQMLIHDNGQSIAVMEGSERLQYKPSVDVTFGSAARSLKGKVLALVLTGMGHDGREGSKLLKREGAHVWTQDEETSVVYGMPMSVERAGYSDLILPIDSFAQRLKQII
ncbi:MAG: chemotaxis response regulator protein-glutamate methylesterase [Pseudomonadales bacterium]|nr:chemotaxis response regulator protein-glutamate methylesterase [Pseudomonadales bacterium]